MSELPPGRLTIADLQRRIFALYGVKDEARGDAGTFLWLAEEFGELATALRSVVELPPSTSAMLRWLKLLMHLTVIVDGLPTRPAE